MKMDNLGIDEGNKYQFHGPKDLDIEVWDALRRMLRLDRDFHEHRCKCPPSSQRRRQRVGVWFATSVPSGGRLILRD